MCCIIHFIVVCASNWFAFLLVVGCGCVSFFVVRLLGFHRGSLLISSSCVVRSHAHDVVGKEGAENAEVADVTG